MAKNLSKLSSKLHPVQFMVLGTLLLIAGAGCQTRESGPTPTPDLSQAEPTVPATSLPEPTQAADLAAGEQESEDYCLACHTDQQALMDTAAPVAADVESESSGEG